MPITALTYKVICKPIKIQLTNKTNKKLITKYIIERPSDKNLCKY